MIDNGISLDIQEGIATLTLNRPEVKNAFDDVLIAALLRYLQQLGEDPSIQAVILRGVGHTFSAGADVRWMKKMINYSKEENIKDALVFAQLLHTLLHLPHPTIALVEGVAYGGALGLVAAADIALATPHTVFCLSEVKIGLVPAVISPYVIRAIGAHATKRYALTAEPFTAQMAQQLGLIHEVILEESQAFILAKLTHALRQNGPKAMRITKKLINTLDLEPQSELGVMHYTANLLAEVRVSQEAQMRLNAIQPKHSSDKT